MLTPGQTIPWTDIIAFLNERSAGIAERIHGASPEQVAALTARAPVPLPENYLQFLSHFGAADGGFCVFPRHYYLAPDLILFPETAMTWDRQQFFLIGFQNPAQACEDPHELFLDLTRSTGHDAPIVGFQPAIPSTEMSLDHGLADWVIAAAGWQYAMKGKSARARLVAWPKAEATDEGIRNQHRALVDLLMKSGFVPGLPATPYTWFGRSQNENFGLVQVDPDKTLIDISLSGSDLTPIRRVSEMLEDLGVAEQRVVTPELS